MAYIALYRAWRPQTFQDVIGQDHITLTLKNSLIRERFSHAYLFNGPRGSGKTSIAKIFAKAINCESIQDGEPCNKCDTCIGIKKGLVLDITEIDAASNRGIDEIRELRENVKFTPTEAKYKVYIIDEVHMLTTEAFNALLKTLEEPPKHAVFILATTEPHKLPSTIVSRCQRFDFKRIPAETMVKRLKFIAEHEGYNVDDQALMLISKYSDGAMRDALSLLDQVLSSSEKDIGINDVFNLTGRINNKTVSLIVKLISEGKTAQVLNEITDLLYEGKEPQKVLEDIIYYYRDMLLYRSVPSIEEIKDKIILDKELPVIASKYLDSQLYTVIEILNKYLYETKQSDQNRVILEMALIKVAALFHNIDKDIRHDTNQNIDILHKKISELEAAIASMQKVNIIKNENVNRCLPSKNNTIDQLEKYNKDFSDENYKKVLELWPNIVQAVKKKKITVYAWFIDGEPVAVTDSVIVLGFNNVMHRDTTNKDQNLALIEEIICEKLGKQYRLLNIMLKDWSLFLNKDNMLEKQGSLTNEEEEKKDLIAKTAELFGEEILIIKE